MPAAPPRLAVRGLRKAYASLVLDGVDLVIAPGEVHALLGANGAGKSTFARIAAGLTSSDDGSMELDGKTYAPSKKVDAERAGVSIVQQELGLITSLTVAENLFFSRLPHRGGFVRSRELGDRAREALSRVGLERLAPETLVEGLGVGVQQLIEIAKALARESKLLILDEPTAALTDPQVRRLFDNVRRLARAGTSVLYISHRLDEIREIADRATVLRDGKVALSRATAQLGRDEMVRAMAGRDVERETSSRTRSSGAVALRVEGLGLGRFLRDVSFTVHRGELFGLAGLIGAGRTTLLRAIFGADRATSGGVGVGPDGSLQRFREPRDAVAAGLAMVPEDRRRDGLLLPLSIRRNVALGVWSSLRSAAGTITDAREDEVVRPVVDRLAVQGAGLGQPVRELSGGNQQKIVLARWLLRDTEVLLLDEPTRGIDVSARATIYRLLRELSESGKAIVVSSSDLEELTDIADRIGVLSAGRMVRVFERGAWSREAITRAAFHEHVAS